jgi:hypothetical protein
MTWPTAVCVRPGRSRIAAPWTRGLGGQHAVDRRDLGQQRQRRAAGGGEDIGEAVAS